MAQAAAVAGFSPQEFLALGFEVRGFTNYTKLNESSQRACFRSLYGTSPSILSMIWADLLHSDLADCQLDAHSKPLHLLIFFRWMRSYETELELKTQFNMGEETLRKWIRIMAKRVAALRSIVVSVCYCHLHVSAILSLSDFFH